MAINQNRPVISYENIALFQSEVSGYESTSNSAENMSFLPLVQGLEFSVDFQRNNAGQIGSKNFINQSFQNAPDVNLTINTFEDFGNLFSCIFTGSIIREDLDLDRNFYAILGDKRSFDISKQSIRGKQVLSFGNCFLQSVSMSQTIAGLIQSSYNFVASNLQASQIEDRIIYFNDYQHLEVEEITNTTETLSDDLGIITITEDDTGGNDSIVGGVFGPGTKSLRMWDNASSLEYNHIYSGVPENGNYLVSGTFITNNGGSLLIKTKSGIANTTVFNGASTQPSSFLASGYVTTDGFITISRIGDGDGDIENVYISDLTIRNLNNRYEINCPAIELTGSQQQNTVSYFDEIDSYYSSDSDVIIPYYSTNVLISGSGSFGNFLMNSESIQSFDLNLPINRKSIYSLGKKYPVKRKALFPSEGSFSFTNKTDDFYVGGERANLDDFLNYDEFYTIFISGKNQKDRDFICKIESGKLDSMNLSNSIGSNTENSLSFSFEINRFNVFFSNALVFTVDTSKAISTSNTEFTVATRSLYTYDCIVDWGDGSTDEINTYDDPKWSHTYSSAGVYQIKISGKFGGFYSVNSLSFQEKLISIDNWGNTEIENFYYAFSSCRQLVSVNDVIPVNSANSFNSCFNLCTSLTTIPSGLFDNCTAAITFSGCFRSCSSLTTIPSGLFDNCTLVTSFYLCFQGCLLLETIPSGLFDNCTLVTNFASCFQNCNSPLLTTIPSGLFDNCNLVINFSFCFNNCAGLNSIPSGLFDNCTLVSNFASCFSNCNGINSIPSGLFDNCTAATTFSGCFANCNLLTAIPSGLFDNCTATTTFSTCFLGCLLLETIPSGLFSNCAAATNFASCFYACVSLKTIPNNIFPSSANNFSNCFFFVTLNTADYSNLLIYLESTNSNNNVPFSGGNSKYNTSAVTARSNLQTDHNWSITDGGAA